MEKWILSILVALGMATALRLGLEFTWRIGTWLNGRRSVER